jgi:co-chaperonin GroES (HSP10)
MTIRPLTGQCLVEILPLADTSGGVVIPQSVQIKDGSGKLPPVMGLVHRLGRWPQKKNGLAVLPEFSPGDRVLCSQYTGTKMKRLGDRYRLVRIQDVLAVVK